jgi:hypothetical protein
VVPAPAPAKDDKSRQPEKTCNVPVVAATPAAAKKQYHCAQCGTTMEKIKSMKCSVCRTTSYCSRECQVTHWPLHKPVCKAKPAVE